ncbi:hypothetical protein RND81_04G098200 [Saponaria officinalis]|uniref:Zinc finger, RING/FYVE/PHD-type n=1 Tax=Saponaria officinalis TaxID=3572 RepID=A0AAW1LDF6_SAPOF
MNGKKRSISVGVDVCDVQKEWDEALCPICMEHPHNAVLLLCSSHAKGCRSYICDTSYRHSNCLDRFRKLNLESRSNSPETPAPPNLQGSDDAEPPVSFGIELPVGHGTHDRNEGIRRTRRSRDLAEYANRREVSERPDFESSRVRSETEGFVKKASLKCPLCRGDVLGWTVVEEARNYLNQKCRSCTRESCTFGGNYCELRRHARTDHPRVRPAEVDQSRQRAWRRFEHQREHEDIVSAIRSAMPGAVVFGDYVIDHSDRVPSERERTSGDTSGSLFPTLFFIQMLESMQSLAGPRSRPWPRTRHRRHSGGSSRQRYLWGENLLGLQDEDGDGDDSFTEEEEMNAVEQGSSSGPRQRRRLSQSRSRRDRS